ncbi:uncharacterized protein PITG_18686 [Phytophthora infestans T30-4]|uniref:Uncharacterized protein n=1 Tax=Phytophthora infestans (strain T30-4) TaxID=403677 RepID=D0NZ05_PHYIT|nr:uncharacterized protein PITG_18686 [Phytophthora infestans T30-4]EEY68792.1 conserved hypothetical protein [Phytophthora infestans T30-4]|eukprot:XP_002997342.1 conserved hypothetical protein [Phytophthora infestans T30-4]
MPPWRLEELQLAASVLEYPISDDEMGERFWNFGGITNRGHLENLLTNRINTTTNHDFLHYEPIDDGRLVETKLVSEMVCKKLSERLLGVIEGRMNEVKGLLDGIPPAASLRGSMFEAKAHAKLRDGLELEHSALSSLLLNKGPFHQPKSKTMDNRILFFQMTVSKTHPVHAFGIIYVLDRLGLLELVRTNPKQAALVFMT